MKKLIVLLISIFALTSVFSQPYLQGGYGAINTTTPTNAGKYFDDGGEFGNYSNYGGAGNRISTETFCSGDGTSLMFTFVMFDVDASDDLTIYDGPDTSSPFIGTYHNGNPISDSVISSGTCLTFVFNSRNDPTASGWEADIKKLPLFTAFDGTNDCPTGTEFYIDIDIINLAGATSVAITNDAGASSITGINSTGIQTIGPFTSGTTVDITVENESDNTCSSTQSHLVPAICPGAGVDCSAAITLEVSTDSGACENMQVGDTDAATGSGVSTSCSDQTYADDDIWYEFEATNDSMTIALRNLGADAGSPNYYKTYLEVYSGSCGSLTSIICDENAYEVLNMETNLTGLTIGDTYYARVWSEWTGNFYTTFDMCLYEPASIATNITCSDALPFCSGTTYVFEPTTGETAESGPDYNCLITQPNPVWYYIKIETGGDIEIDMTAENDIDFICWGPFDNITCNSSYFQSENEVDCSYSSSHTETCEITTANGGAAISGKYYIFCITNYANIQQTIYFEQGAGTGVTDCDMVDNILPVELISIKAQNINFANVISWKTSSEINNNYFIVERSIDAINWSSIGEVNSTGSSNNLNSYSYSDINYEKKQTYYRLKQVDYDGRLKILDIVTVNNTRLNIKIIDIINVMGRPVNEDYKGIKIYRYSDGSVIKRYNP